MDHIPNKELKIGLCQMAMNDSPQANLAKAVELIRKGAKSGAKVLCLPELFRTPYFCTTPEPARDWSEEVPGEVGATFSKLAAELEVVIVGGSVFESVSGVGMFNTSMVYGPTGDLLGTYRKVHIPHDPGFYEKHYFTPGDLGFKVFDTPFARVAVLICFDQWFPEAARAVALAGADIIFYPTAISTVDGIAQAEGSWAEAWENVQRGHAISNSVIVAAVNRVGREGESTFWGRSFVCDAFGKTLARAGANEEVLTTTVNIGHSDFIRENWRFFPNRRPDQYQRLFGRTDRQ